MKRLIATLALATVALAAAACGTTNAGQPGTPAASIDPSAPAVTARNMAFDQQDVVVPGGAAFQLAFTNADGAPHNIAIYTDSSASTAVFRGDVISASAMVYSVPALAAGSYFFRCDVHPEMHGTITAR